MRQREGLDRDEVAELLREMLTTTQLTVPQLAREIPVDPSTVYRWLRKEQSALPEQIRDAARAAGYDPIHALARVGWLTPAEAGVGRRSPRTAERTPDPIAREIDRTLARDDVPDQAKGALRRMIGDVLRTWSDMLQISPPGRRDG